jgi:hypothetical protein
MSYNKCSPELNTLFFDKETLPSIRDDREVQDVADG